jgi:K+-transporting ATPase ATPase C chain
MEKRGMLTHLRTSIWIVALFTVLTGLVYPALITLLARTVFPLQAAGSVVTDTAGEPLGSALVGQPFSDPAYFWTRPSATGGFPYNAAVSSGSNLGPLNPALTDAVSERIAALRAADPDNTGDVPVDLVTASASGLDPHISPAAAEFQAERVAHARGMSSADVHALIAEHTEGRALGVLGEPRVNVLLLNLALDGKR